MGSSPLTRGKLRRWAGTRARGRLIPAHAGKTPRSSQNRRRRKAHPRSRGENGSALFSNVPEPGSSPLTRGKRWWPGRFGVLVGLIPAHAGKTRGEERTHTVGWAHPRSRGENRGRRRLHLRGRGSSPLTRGKRVSGCSCGALVRLIPAHAGKTGKAGYGRASLRAHPRSRGENCWRMIASYLQRGSSPLTRGKQ